MNTSLITNIYFVRHGEVQNPNKIWYGRLPFFGLSEKGKLQIENVAKLLADRHIDVIYSSPLLRSKQSAQIIKKTLGLSKIHYSKRILEDKSTTYQGKPFSLLDKVQYRVFATDDNKVVGETIEQLSNRMQKFISKIVRLYKGKNIVVVSHGDQIMIVKAKAENNKIDIESIRRKVDYIKTGGIYLLRI